jgi:two-component system, LytTR family, sensor kinase
MGGAAGPGASVGAIKRRSGAYSPCVPKPAAAAAVSPTLAPWRDARFWAASFAAWLVLSLAFLPQFLVTSARAGAPLDSVRVLVALFATFIPWAVLTPAVAAFAAWKPWRAPWPRTLAWHASAAVACVTLQLVAMEAIKWTLGQSEPWAQAWPRLLLGYGATGLLIYAGLLALGMAMEASACMREAQRQRASAELLALKSQLQPHFLFNALNAIAELGYSDPKRAEGVTLRLAGLLRRVLAGSQQEGVTLADELEMAADALAIHEALLGERLRWRIDVPDGLRAEPVPPLLLQPLVENAVRHGVAPHPAGGEAVISARRDGARLAIEVRNSGEPLPIESRAGVGLSNVRRRLEVLHGQAASLELGAHEGWTVARLTLPARGAA